MVNKTREKTSNEEHKDHGFFGSNTELIFSILSGVLLSVGYILSIIDEFPEWGSLVLYIGAYFFGGYYTTKEVIKKVLKGALRLIS